MFASKAASFFTLVAVVTTATASEHGSFNNRAHDIFLRAAPCAAGSYANSAGVCTPCEPGNYCATAGASKKQCNSGTYQPASGQTSCIPATNGSYVPNNGATSSTPCAAGSYQPRAGQNFCYGAPSGRFASQPGMRGVCGACCGWTTTQTNYNTGVVKCSGSTPFSGRASGSGCVSTRQGCDPVATCAQAANGACPDQSFEFVGPAPTPLSRVIQVFNTNTNAPLGYVSQTQGTYAAYGLFVIDADPANAILFDIQLDPSLQSGSQLNIKATTTTYAATYPFMGGIVGVASDSNDFASGSSNYAYVQGTSQTSPNAPPQSVPNSFPSPASSESAIWSFDRTSLVVQPVWVNTDGTKPTTFLMYVDQTTSIAITGDVQAFSDRFGGASAIYFKYIP
ncbi:hypothetical protein MIND_00136300 [Mycena indigotica]|uniref:Uncharacterized protein n=1 Tax=Mycena indigotica TaxID=2126181 RepID=A0A8H6TGC9_9AGAR|nr:uncharacterized protein MIND_00136300 [Mycena indigotica]KAF7316181.1 hypothetical protein MIND_00136300 [Mycena indigotica]